MQLVSRLHSKSSFFIGAYFYKDIFFATMVLMVVMPIALALQWFLTRKLNKIYAASTGLVLVLGGVTLHRSVTPCSFTGSPPS